MITKNNVYDTNINCQCNEHDCQCDPKCPCIQVYDDIELAIEAANNIRLAPGKTYMSYYKDPDIYGKTRCVIAVGNVTSGQKHVIFDNIVDYKEIEIIKNKISNIEEEIINLKLADTELSSAIQSINNSYVKMTYTIIDPNTGLDVLKTMNILVKN